MCRGVIFTGSFTEFLMHVLGVLTVSVTITLVTVMCYQHSIK